jgi:ribulose-5-phosphate 4-epimerase/fuculose-1-phosphate aldolase
MAGDFRDDAGRDLDLTEARRTISLACRVLAHAGLAEDVLGHVSMRLPEGRLLVRCRGPEERGLLFTRDEDIRLVDLEGEGELGGYALPNEFPIHAELLKARPEVDAVVHAHPPAVLVAGLAGVPMRPVFGAYNIPASVMASDGVPVYPRAVLIRTAALGQEMVAAMGKAPVCLLRGHGATAVGSSVEQAVVRALNLEALARVCVEISRVGSEVVDIAAEDAQELPDLGSSFNDTLLWRHHLARLEHAGLAAF